MPRGSHIASEAAAKQQREIQAQQACNQGTPTNHPENPRTSVNYDPTTKQVVISVGFISPNKPHIEHKWNGARQNIIQACRNKRIEFLHKSNTDTLYINANSSIWHDLMNNKYLNNNEVISANQQAAQDIEAEARRQEENRIKIGINIAVSIPETITLSLDDSKSSRVTSLLTSNNIKFGYRLEGGKSYIDLNNKVGKAIELLVENSFISSAAKDQVNVHRPKMLIEAGNNYNNFEASILNIDKYNSSDINFEAINLSERSEESLCNLGNKFNNLSEQIETVKNLISGSSPIAGMAGSVNKIESRLNKMIKVTKYLASVLDDSNEPENIKETYRNVIFPKLASYFSAILGVVSNTLEKHEESLQSSVAARSISGGRG